MNGAPRPVTNHTAGTWKEGFSLSHRQVFANSLVESLKKIPIGGPPERIVKYAQQIENNAFETAQSREEYFAIMRERMEYVRTTVDRRRNAALNNGQVQVPQGQAPQHPPQPPQPSQQPILPQQQAQFVPQQRPPEDMFNTVHMNQQPHQSNPLSQFQQQASQAQPPQAPGPVSDPNLSGNQPQYNAAYQNALRQLMSQQQQQQNQQQGRNMPLTMQAQQGQSGILSQATPTLQQNHQNPRNAAILSMMQQQQARLQAHGQQGNVPTQQQQQSNQQLAQQFRQRFAQNGGRGQAEAQAAMLQLIKQQQQRQQQAPQQQQQDQVMQQMQQSPQQPQDSQTSTSMQQVRSAAGQITNDGNTPNNYVPNQQAQMQMFRKLVQSQKQQEQQSAVAGQMQQPRRIGQMMNSAAQQQPIMTQRDQQLSGTHLPRQEQQEQDSQSQQHLPQQESQQPQVMQPNGPPQRAAIAQNAGRLPTNVLQTEQGQPPSHPQLTQQQLDATVKNYVLKSKIPQALLKIMSFLPPEVNTWTQIYNLMKSHSIPGDVLPIIRNVHAQNEQLVRNLFTKQGNQAQRFANDSQTSLQGSQLPMHMAGVIQVTEDAQSSPVMMNQQPTNQRPGAPVPKIEGSPSSSRDAMMTVQQHQISQGPQPQHLAMNQQASMTIPHQYSGQNTTPIVANMNITPQQQQQQAQMSYNKILTQSPQRKQTTPIIQPSQMPSHNQPQHQWMMDSQQTSQQISAQQVQQPLQGNIPLQNVAGQVELERASNSQKPPYGPEQQEQDRARIRELYEEVSRSRTKQPPVELLPEDQTKTREMILQLQEACRQMDRLIHWAHANFHNDSVTKRLIAMQFAYRDQFEVLNRGIFYFTPESIAKFRVELSKFFNYVRRHHQLKQGNGGASIPMNMGMPLQQSASGSHVLMPQQQGQQTVAQVTPQDRIQQGQQVQMPPGRLPQQQMMSAMPHQGGQQMTFEPNLASADLRQRQGNATPTPTTTSAIPPQQQPAQQQQQQQQMMMSQPRQGVAAGSYSAQQFVPQSIPGSAMPVSAPIPAPTPRQSSRRNQKAPAAAGAQAQAAVAAGNGVPQPTPKQFPNTAPRAQRQSVPLPGQLPGQAPIIIPQPQPGKSENPSAAVRPSPVVSSAASPQGLHTPMAHFDPAQLKVPQSRKRSLGVTTSGRSNESIPVIDSEPPLKKEKTEPKAAAKGKQTAAQVKAAAAAQTLAVAAEDANAKQRAAAEEIAAKRRELAVKDPLGYALQAIADICGVDPQTGKDVEGPDSSRTGILSQVKVMYSELLPAIC
ncbi:hypothetical protein V1506DRAFT_137117 [Lipomyces tetrasporus]